MSAAKINAALINVAMTNAFRVVGNFVYLVALKDSSPIFSKSTQSSWRGKPVRVLWKLVNFVPRVLSKLAQTGTLFTS